MIKHMDRDKLRFFLLETIKELSAEKGFSMESDFRFRITANPEEGKKHDSIDDLMKLGMYTDGNIKGREVDFMTLTKMLSCAPHSRYPLWVEVSVVEMQEESVLFHVETSLRFRSPKMLSNQDTGHPPFKAVF